MTATCSVADCAGTLRSLGLCSPHYFRQRKYGDPLHPVTPQDSAGKLAWLQALAVAEPTNECVDWPWGAPFPGYGLYRYENYPHRVTHLVLIFSGRPRPPGPNIVACHSCDRRICCAPWHLRWDTQSSNVQDAYDRNRRPRAFGVTR